MQTADHTAQGPKQQETPQPLDIEQLFILYADDILRVCSVYLGKRSLAEDAFQDVFVKVSSRAGSFRGDTPVRFWLLAIARNVCRDYLRSYWLTRVVSFEDRIDKKQSENGSESRRKSAGGDGIEDAIVSRLDNEFPLLKAVQALPARYKDVILLRFYFDMGNEEIAKQLSITESTVRSRIFRARKKLSSFMDGEEMP